MTARRPPSPRVRRGWKIVGSLVTVPLLLFGATQVASALAHEERTETTSVDATGLRRVEIDNNAGSIRIVGIEGADRVIVNARISDGLRATEHDVRREGDTLVVASSCPIWLSDWCSARYTIELPSRLAVVAWSSDGSVTASDIAATVEASSDNGRIELARIKGDVVLNTDNGSVTGTALRASRAEATSDNGGIALEFLEAPRNVVATTDNGSIDVVLPDTGTDVEDLYRIDANSDNGAVSTGGVGTHPDAGRTITAESDNGDVTIAYAVG